MAMRIYGVETQGVAIKFDEMRELILSNKENVLKAVGEDFFENIDEIDFNEVTEFVENITWAFWVSGFDGTLIKDDFSTELDYFDDDEVVILELQNNTLYKKYNNRDEIILELKNTLKEVGIVVDDEFIEKHYGKVNGSYCG